jgi:hypothetical protein
MPSLSFFDSTRCVLRDALEACVGIMFKGALGIVLERVTVLQISELLSNSLISEVLRD